ncbi:DUF2326 domain-containing protein [Sesbania bispinosa]|nr:DUF2326 domain-containing protein [Sesbania bispinosa]
MRMIGGGAIEDDEMKAIEQSCGAFGSEIAKKGSFESETTMKGSFGSEIDVSIR